MANATIRTYAPVTPVEKVQAATELLADVAQVLAGVNDPAAQVAAKVIQQLMPHPDRMRSGLLGDILATVKAVGQLDEKKDLTR